MQLVDHFILDHILLSQSFHTPANDVPPRQYFRNGGSSATATRDYTTKAGVVWLSPASTHVGIDMEVSPISASCSLQLPWLLPLRSDYICLLPTRGYLPHSELTGLSSAVEFIR